MKTKILILGFALSLTILSCNREQLGSPISSDDAKASAKIDAMNDDVSNLVEEQETSTYDNPTTGKMTDSGVSQLTTCGTISRVPDWGTALSPGDEVVKTINFGAGCTLSSGNVVSGIIIITFFYNPNETTHTINYSFNNFTHNGIAFNGNKTFTRTMITTADNPTSHPQVTMTMDLTANIPGLGLYHRVGSRVREIIAGYGDGNLTTNVYKITGSWDTTTPSGAVQHSVITTPLHVRMSCLNVNKPLIVSGIITITREATSGTLDFGNGDCDNLAVFTVNGNSYNIIIGN